VPTGSPHHVDRTYLPPGTHHISRSGQQRFCASDTATGEITQITDFEPPEGADLVFLSTCVNPQHPVAYFWYGRELRSVHLHTYFWEALWEAPAGWRPSMINVTADGRFLCGTISEDVSDRIRCDYLRGYVGFRETFEARPLSRLFRLCLETGQVEIVHEDRHWFGHCNTSPTRPHLLTFCHEGPWDLVDHRIWGCDLRTGRVWRIAESDPGDRIGHEYWLADGETVGYHGVRGGTHIHGFIRYDNTEREEIPCRRSSTHFHSNTRDLIVGDDRPGGYLLLWRRKDGELEGPRILARHRSSFHIQQTHVHPRFSPDGSQVLYTSDDRGYGDVYLVDVPEFDDLSPAETNRSGR